LGADVRGFALAADTSPSLYEAAELGALLETAIADVRDASAVAQTMERTGCEIVFHLAAQSLVRASYADPLYTFGVNAMGTANVLDAARRTGSVRTVLCVTTDKCYENREWVWPYRENDRLGGRDPYSGSKACAELVASSYRCSFFSGDGAPSIATARGGNVIGGGDWSTDRIVPDLVRAFAQRTPGIVRNPDAVRPWQFVLDALHGYMLLMQRMYERPGDYCEAWNFGPDPSAERRVADIADGMTQAWGTGASWKHEPPEKAPHEASMLKLDSSKARARLNWRDRVPTGEAIARTGQWYVRFYGGSKARDLMDADLDDFAGREGTR
jgi:CDP-glucose 4,6-dehydratase